MNCRHKACSEITVADIPATNLQHVYDLQAQRYDYCRDVQHAKRQRALTCVGKINGTKIGPMRTYIAVGSNACEQFIRLGGCTNALSLWGISPGDVQPDPNCKSLYIPPSNLPDLICALNPPDPNFVPCGPRGWAKTPFKCRNSSYSGSAGPNFHGVCSDLTAQACNDCSSGVA